MVEEGKIASLAANECGWSRLSLSEPVSVGIQKIKFQGKKKNEIQGTSTYSKASSFQSLPTPTPLA
jgi:hypothetical protein